jgi:hypothetical protein
VIDELAEERGAGRVRWIVRIVGAERRVRDQQDRAALQRILGIHDAARLAELGERRRELRARCRKRRQLEDAAEAILAQRRRHSLRVRCCADAHHAHARCQRAGCAERAEKTAAAHSPQPPFCRA